jgi:hypothetical protein
MLLRHLQIVTETAFTFEKSVLNHKQFAFQVYNMLLVSQQQSTQSCIQKNIHLKPKSKQMK